MFLIGKADNAIMCKSGVNTHSRALPGAAIRGDTLEETERNR